MMATVPHITSGLGLRKFQADGFLLARVYIPNVGTPPLTTIGIFTCTYNCNVHIKLMRLQHQHQDDNLF